MKVKTGEFNELEVVRVVSIGAYLDDGGDGILLPKRYMPDDTGVGDRLKVFIYHDSESRMIATTEHPAGVVGDIVLLRVVSVTPQGAFMDWGLPKDIFVPKSQQKEKMYKGEQYLVKIYLDAQTGRVAATSKIDSLLSNEKLTVADREQVNLIVYRLTDIGYFVIINNRHTGVLHYSDVFRELSPGDRLQGFIKKITTDNKIDVMPGIRGYDKVSGEEEKILHLLTAHNGYLPYHDKSDPEDIYRFFGMSKKIFKMTTGSLYKQRKIEFTSSGIRLIDEAAGATA